MVVCVHGCGRDDQGGEENGSPLWEMYSITSPTVMVMCFSRV